MLVNGAQHSDIKKVNFKGIQKTKDTQGYESYNLFLPYDTSKYTAVVEVVSVVKKDGEWHPDKEGGSDEIQMNDKTKVAFNPADLFLDDQSFGYRFKLIDKNNKDAKPIYHTDNGINIGKEDPEQAQFVIIHRNKAPGKMPGVMIHGLADNFNPGFKMENGKVVPDTSVDRNALLNVGRTHFNNYGGNIPGMIEKLPHLKEQGYTQFLSTPLFGADEMSSHGYWTTNPNQINKKFGNLNDFRAMAAAMHKNGMTFFADGAIVNEGMCGIHYKYNLKWGEKSPFRHYIKGDGYKKPSVLPDIDVSTAKGKEEYSHFKIKVINGDKTYSYTNGNITSSSYQRDKSQPTYIQIYDDRLVSDAQVANNEVITRYGKHETGNHFDIATHNDSVLPFAFEIPEDEIASFHKRMEENQGKYKSGDHQDFLLSVGRFANFQIGLKGPGNSNNWDGNADVFKSNFTYTNKDEQDLTLKGATPEEKKFYEESTFQVQDSAQKVGIYWTKMYGGAILEHDAKALKAALGDGFKNIKDEDVDKKVSAYKEALKSPELHPAAKNMISDEEIKNVITGNYRIPQLEKSSVPREQLCESIMNYPLTAIEFSPDLTAVLDTPYLSKKACNKEDVTKTRNELFKTNNYRSMPKDVQDTYYHMDKFYEHAFTSLANKIVEQADKEGNLGLIERDGDKERHLTEKGQMVLPLITADITKFLVVKSLAPKVEIKNNNGVLEYDESIRKVGLKNLDGGNGISARTPQEEAQKVFDLLRDGLSKIEEKDTEALTASIKTRFQGVSAESLKMSQVIIDKTEAGMNWRTDATKDEIEVDNIRNGTDEFGTEWNKSITFWKGFVDGIRKENPNSIIITEMTDLEDQSIAANGAGRFKNNMHAQTQFVEETGATTISNYVVFSDLQRIATRDAETGSGRSDSLGGLAGFISGQDSWGGINKGHTHNTSADGSRKAHNFIGNHDKPRILHTLALDMGIFHNVNDKQIQDNIKYLGKKYAQPILEQGLNPDTKALAMASMIDTHMMPSIAKAKIEDPKAEEKLRGAISDLVQGNFKERSAKNGNAFDPEHFGAEDPEFAIRDVIIQAKLKHGLVLSEKQTKKLEDHTRANALKAGMEKSLILKKILMSMPGDYTEYAGDPHAMGGYEAACKNIHVKNRGIIPWEYLDKEHKQYKPFVARYYREHKKLNERRQGDDLSALGNGETHRLEVGEHGGKVEAMFRYNDKSELLVINHVLNLSSSLQNLEALDAEKKQAPHEINVNKGDYSIASIDISPKKTSDKNGTIIAGLAGGLAIGTIFKNAIGKPTDTVLGVCQEGDKSTIRQFETEGHYRDYVSGDKTLAENAKPIQLTDNSMILKRVEAGADLKKVVEARLKAIHFKGRTPHHNKNYFQIQAYLNSKTHLNAEARYTSIAK